jgi:branched-chain amino acid transport system ATP-binding protein
VTLLAVDGVTKRFRGLVAVDAVSFDVTAGEIFAVIGPNGAGKTTLFNLLAGVHAPDSGRIAFAGERIEGLRPDEIARRGIGRTFQIVRPFPNMTVHGAAVETARDAARAILARLELDDQHAKRAAELTLPDRKRLEVARALATAPRLLLLDEVMAGLRPTEVDRIVAILRAINRESGMTIILIEHVMRAVMALAARVLVLHHGAVIATGAPEAIVRHPEVMRSYLGTEALG